MPTRSQLIALRQKVQAQRPMVQANAGVSDVYGKLSPIERAVKGGREGIADTVGQIMNIAGVEKKIKLPGALPSVDSTDAGLNGRREQVEQMGLGTAGTVGSIAGSTALTAPVGGLIGGGAKALAPTALRAAPVLGRALQTAGAVATNPYTNSAAQGALYGAIAGGPDNRGEGAAIGAALGPTMTAGAKGLSRVAGRGLVKATDAAKDLMDRTGQLVPIQLGSEDGLAKTIYQNVLRAVPGVGKVLEEQRNNIVKSWESLAQNRMLPVAVRARLSTAKSPYEAMQIAAKFYKDDAYAPIAKFAINRSMVDTRPLMAGVRDAGKGTQETLSRIIDTELRGKAPTMQNLFNVRTRAKEAGIKLGSNANMNKWIDENVASQLSNKPTSVTLSPGFVPKTKAEKALVNYLELKEPYTSFKIMEKAVAAVPHKGGITLPAALARVAAKKAGTGLAAQGRETMGDIAKLGVEGMDAANLGAPRPGFFQTLAVNAPALPAAPVLWPAARAAVAPGTQRWLMGMQPHQQKLAAFLLQNKGGIETAGNIGRAATTQLIKD